MPGILYHLSFAKEVYRKLGTVIRFDKLGFMSGNLIPDLAMYKKELSLPQEGICGWFFCSKNGTRKERPIQT